MRRAAHPTLFFVVFVAVAATLLTAVFTTPVLFFISDRLAGFYGSDGFGQVWAMWWFDKALFDLRQSPAQVSWLSYPVGLYHPALTAAPYIRLVTLPLVRINPVAAYNVHLLLSFVLTWVFTALLCYELTGNRAAALVGGAVFAFFPNKTNHALQGHINVVIVYWFPFLAWQLLRLLRQPSFWKAVGCGLTLALALSVEMVYVPFLVVPLVVGLVGFAFARLPGVRRSRKVWLGLGGIALVALPFLLPGYVPLLLAALQGRLGYYQTNQAVQYSADLLGLFLPSPLHPVYGVWPALRVLSARSLFDLGSSENIVYGGIVALPLAAWGAWRWWRRKWDVPFWVGLAAIAMVLSLGPVLRVAGQLTEVPLPYALLKDLPVLSWNRTPARLNQTAMLAVAVLVSYGVAALLEKRVRISRQIWVAVLLALVILFDYVVMFPWPVAPATAPPFCQWLAGAPGEGAVLDLPVWDYTANNLYMWHQMIHDRPIVGGYLYRRSAEAEAAMEELERLALPGGDPRALAAEGIGYVVLHREFMSDEEVQTLAHFLEMKLGAPVYQDAEALIFATRPEARE
jgi:hypothetical protein